MEGFKKIDVNGREYTLIMMSPTQAHDYFYDLTAAEERKESIARFDKMAIGQCSDPMMRPLKDAGNFEQCFSDHPEDMLLLGRRARDELILPFLPKKPDTKPPAKS